MQLAIEQAQYAAVCDEVPIGCVITYEGTIIARAHNLKESNNDPTGHAEIIAIKQACVLQKNWRLNDCVLYVTTEPCIMCIGAILHARIKKVVFGCPDLKWGGLGTIIDINALNGLNHHIDVEGGVASDSCKELLSTFFKQKRQKNKQSSREG